MPTPTSHLNHLPTNPRDAVRKVLDDNFVSLYLHGSFAVGSSLATARAWAQ